MMNNWIFIDNSGDPYETVAEGSSNNIKIFDINSWEQLKHTYHEKE